MSAAAAAVPVTLGVDVGTTDTKVAAVGFDGTVLAIGRVPTRWRQQGGRAETSAEQLVDGVLLAARHALEQVAAEGRAASVRGVGVTGMAEAGVLLDRSGRPAGPVIAWFDERGAEEAAALPAGFADIFAARTGLGLTALPTFSKLLWRRRAEDIQWRGTRWLNVPEYVVRALGGEQVTEPSLASRTGLLDQDTARPFESALELLGAGTDLLPPLVPAGTPAGTVGDGAPSSLRGAVLTVAGHDHPVASVGAGALGADDLFDSCGTAEALVRVTKRSDPAQRRWLAHRGVASGLHVIPGRRILLGGTRGGILLRRVLSLLGATEARARDALDQACPLGEPDPEVCIEPLARESSLLRLRVGRDDVTPAMVWRAALDRADAEARALAEVFAQVAGIPTRTWAAGGWTRLASFRAVKQRGFPGVRFSAVDQPGLTGAAAFAALAADPPSDPAVQDVAAFVATFLALDDIGVIPRLQTPSN